MRDPYDRDSRDYDPERVRPKDLDEAILTPQERNLNRAATTMDNAGKIAKPIYAMVLGLLAMGVWFGKFYSEYSYNAENGSPAVRTLIAGQQTQINNQQRSIEQLTYIVDDLKRRQDKDDDRRAGGRP